MGTVQSRTQQSIMPEKVKLTYFNLRGRAEPLLLLLAYGGIQFEDCRLTPGFVDPTEWTALKPSTPYGGLPLLCWNGETIAQSKAAMRFVAKQVGVGGRNNLEGAQIDEVVDALTDIMEKGAQLFFAKDDAGMKKHMERRTVLRGQHPQLGRHSSVRLLRRAAGPDRHDQVPQAEEPGGQSEGAAEDQGLGGVSARHSALTRTTSTNTQLK